MTVTKETNEIVPVTPGIIVSAADDFGNTNAATRNLKRVAGGDKDAALREMCELYATKQLGLAPVEVRRGMSRRMLNLG